MNTFRSASAAVAGPGPQTWLYRASLGVQTSTLSRATSTQVCPAAAARAIHTTLSVQKSLRPKTPRPNRPAPKARAQNHPKQHPQPPKYPRIQTTTVPYSQSSPLDDVIYLRAPPDYPIDEDAAKLRDAWGNRSVDSALSEWGHLNDLGCIGRLSDEDFSLASRFVRDILIAPPYVHLGKLAIFRPHDFGLLRHMAMESAAHGHTAGLYVYMLKLVEAGRPKDAVDTFSVCKDRMRDIQGKDKNDLVSWVREKRLAARLQGDGLKDLMMVNIAALTLLDSCDEHALFNMLDSQADLRPTSKTNFAPIHRALRIAKAGDAMYDNFRQNVDNLVLAVMCYHPTAFSARITMLGLTRAGANLEKLYDRVLEGSIGSDAFIRPRDLGDFGVVYTNIPLPPTIWLDFIKVFEWRSDVNRLARMIDHDLPARGLEPNAHFLSAAMLHMTIISHRKSIPSSVRNEALAFAEEYWRRLTSKGWHLDDGAFSRRIRSLGIQSKRNHKMRSEVSRLYQAAEDGHLGRIGPKTRAAFVEFFVLNGRLENAFAVFDTFPWNPDPAAGDSLDHAFSTFIRRLSLGYWTNEEKLNWCNKALALYIGAGFSIRSHALGPLLSVQLKGGLPLKKTVDAILDATMYEDSPQAGIARWTKVIHGLLTKFTHTQSPTILELEAALFILHRASKTELFGANRGRQVSMWMTYLVPLAKSTSTDARKRQELMDMAIDLFPGGKQNISIGMWLELIGVLFSRSDRNGYGEGWRRYNEVRALREIPGIAQDKMLSLLLQHKRNELALDLVRDAWSSTTVHRTEGFWLRAQAAGLTRQLGIDSQLEAEQAVAISKVQRKKRILSGPLASTDDLAKIDRADEGDSNGDADAALGVDAELGVDDESEDEDAESKWEIVEEDEEETVMDMDKSYP